MSKIVIALATRNGARFLPDFFASAATQTRPVDKILVGDDESSDQTSTIIEEAAALGLDIEMLPAAGERLGVTGNFARVLSHTEAKFVLLADQDDVWYPTKVEKLLAAAEAIDDGNTPLLAYSDAHVVNTGGDVVAESLASYQGFELGSGLQFRRVLMQNTVAGCVMLINRALLHRALPIPAEAVMHDWWLLLVASALGKVVCVDEPLIAYRRHESNTLGVERWGFLRTVKTIAEGPKRTKRRVKQHLHVSIAQARSLRTRFGDSLGSEKCAEIGAFLSLAEGGPIHRRLTATQWGFRKEGRLRTLAFYLLL